MTDITQLREILRPLIRRYNLAEFIEAIYRETLYWYPKETRAAIHLGVTRNTIRNKMVEYDISRESLRADRTRIAMQLELKNGQKFTSK